MEASRAIFPERESPRVHEVFYSIQGEGPRSGAPAIFFRLWGCESRCPACDTGYGRADRREPVKCFQ